MKNEDFGRPIIIHICKDGTISYRKANEKVFNGRALPVFSVDNEEQARAVQIRFGRLQWNKHPQIPNTESWYRWTDFDGTLEALDEVSLQIRQFYYGILRKQAA